MSIKYLILWTSLLLLPQHLLAQQPILATGIGPMTNLVRMIAGDQISITQMIPAGQNPHSYEPKLSQIQTLTKAEIFFAMGTEAEERWQKQLQSLAPKMQWHDLGAGLRIPMQQHQSYMASTSKPQEAALHGEKDGHDEHHEDKHHPYDEDKDEKHHHEEHHHEEHHHEEHHDEDHHDEDHHDEDHHDEDHHHEEHHHEEHHHHHDHEKGEDPHVWLSTHKAQALLHKIYDILVKANPSEQATYQRNLQQAIQQMQNLGDQLKKVGQNHPVLMTFHPSWGYLADDLGIKQLAIEVEGKEPSPKVLGQIYATAKQKGASFILVSPEFSQKSAQVLAKNLGIPLVAISPLDPEYPANLAKIAQALDKTP